MAGFFQKVSPALEPQLARARILRAYKIGVLYHFAHQVYARKETKREILYNCSFWKKPLSKVLAPSSLLRCSAGSAARLQSARASGPPCGRWPALARGKVENKTQIPSFPFRALTNPTRDSIIVITETIAKSRACLRAPETGEVYVQNNKTVLGPDCVTTKRVAQRPRTCQARGLFFATILKVLQKDYKMITICRKARTKPLFPPCHGARLPVPDPGSRSPGTSPQRRFSGPCGAIHGPFRTGPPF